MIPRSVTLPWDHAWELCSLSIFIVFLEFNPLILKTPNLANGDEIKNTSKCKNVKM